MAPIADREPNLPANARAYRRLGSFDADSIPAGLWRRHQLKPGVWGVLSVDAGSIRFCWDDKQGGTRILSAGEALLIPPVVPHHLEREGPVAISLAFHAVSATTPP